MTMANDGNSNNKKYGHRQQQKQLQPLHCLQMTTVNDCNINNKQQWLTIQMIGIVTTNNNATYQWQQQ